MMRVLTAVFLCLAMVGSVSAQYVVKAAGQLTATTGADGKTTYSLVAKLHDVHNADGKIVEYLLRNVPGSESQLKGVIGKHVAFNGVVTEENGKMVLTVVKGPPSAPVPTGGQTVTGVLKAKTLTAKVGDREVVYTLSWDTESKGSELLIHQCRALDGKTVKIAGNVTEDKGLLRLYGFAIKLAQEKVTGALKVTKDGMTVTAKEGGKDVVYTLAKSDDPANPMPPEIKAITETAKALDGKTVEVVGTIYNGPDGSQRVAQREIKEVPAGK